MDSEYYEIVYLGDKVYLQWRDDSGMTYRLLTEDEVREVANFDFNEYQARKEFLREFVA